MNDLSIMQQVFFISLTLLLYTFFIVTFLNQLFPELKSNYWKITCFVLFVLQSLCFFFFLIHATLK